MLKSFTFNHIHKNHDVDSTDNLIRIFFYVREGSFSIFLKTEKIFHKNSN